MHIGTVCSPWLRSTLPNTCRRWAAAITGWTRTIYMVTTWSHTISFAVFFISIKPARAYPPVLKIWPRTLWVSAITTITARYAATWKNILRRNSSLISLIWSHTKAITHRLSSSKGPAGPAISLISYLFDWLAVRPLFPRVEILRGLSWDCMNLGEFHVFGCGKSSHERSNGYPIHIGPSFVMACSPRGISLLNLPNNLVEVNCSSVSCPQQSVKHQIIYEDLMYLRAG